MDIWDQTNFDFFPQSLQDLVEHIGESGVRALARDFRGQKIYVPSARLENKALLKTLGKEALERWSSAQGGLYFAVPLCKKILKEQRNSDIKQKKQEGWSFSDLMEHFGLSRATLQLVVRRS